MSNIEFKTVPELFDALGVSEIRRKGGFTKQALSNWRSDNQIPAARFDFFDALCKERGHVTPRHLFGFAPRAEGEAA